MASRTAPVEIEEAHVALVGMMAVGKSTIGRALADRMGVTFVDVDDVVESRTGRTLRELWRDGGEEAYRPLEREAVRGALGRGRRVVLAVPGGVAVDVEMAAAVTAPGVTVVHLRAGLDTLVARAGTHPGHRPLLGDDPRAAFQRLLAEREGRYEALADHVIDVDRLTPAGVLMHVVRIVASGTRRPVEGRHAIDSRASVSVAAAIA